MTRYTKYDGKRIAFADPYEEHLEGQVLIEVLLHRLARYEDTGLSPNQIHTILHRVRSIAGMTDATFGRVVDLLQQEASPPPAAVVDFEECDGKNGLTTTLCYLNARHWDVVAVTQSHNKFIVFFRRPKDG